MKSPRSALETAFLQDHQLLTRSFAQIKEALLEGDITRARRLADELDRQAGPHIAFEEEVFYPELARVHDPGEVKKFYYEHELGRKLLSKLLEVPEESALQPHQTGRLAEIAQTVLDHAFSCGTLFSHILALDESQQRLWLDQLEAYRSQPLRWTGRPDSSSTDTHQFDSL